MTEPVVVELRGDGRGVIAAFRTTREEAERLDAQLGRNTRGAERYTGQTRRASRATEQYSRATGSASRTLRRMAGAATFAISALGVGQIAQAADQWTRFEARLNLVTDTSEQAAQAQERILDIANASGSAVDAVGELYVRLAQSLGDAGASAGELETITEAVTQSMRVSGASAAQSAGAIRQLSQSFAAGVLRGDEFNSVNEQAPRLMQALADSLGITRGELRGLAEQGQLTSDILRRALIDQADEIAAESASIPQTMGEALTSVQNSVRRTIGVLDEATGASAAVAEAFSNTADFVDRLAGAFDRARDQVVLANRDLDDMEGRAVDAANAMNQAALAVTRFTAGLIGLGRIASATVQTLGVLAEEFSAFNGLQASVDKLKSGDILGGLFGPGARPAFEFIMGDGFNDFGIENGGIAAISEFFRILNQSGEQTEELAEKNEDAAERIGAIWSTTLDDINQDFRVADLTAELFAQTIDKVDRNSAQSANGIGELTSSLRDFALDSATAATERAGEVAESVREMDDAIADLSADLGGPYARALREYQTAAQEVGERFRAFEITGAQAGEMLDLLTERFERQRDEIGQGLAAELERLAFDTLPPVIRQMLGLADATGQVAQQAGALSQIGSNFATAVLNGQGVQSALGSALTGFGGQGIGDFLDDNLAGFVETAFTDGISAAFESQDFQRNSAAGFALALGQAVEGNLGQAAFTAAGNALGGPIGALIGSIIGDAVFGESVPKFQVRGRNASQATDAGTDRVISTAFGAELEIAFRGIEDTAKRQIVRGYSEFLNALSGVVRDPGQQSAIANVISRFGISSRSGPDDIEGQLELLFDDVLGTFDAFTRQFVEQAETLDGQVQRLNDLLRLEDLEARGRTLGLEFQELATVLDEVAIGGESILDTFSRLEPVVNGLERAADLVGRQFAESQAGLTRFGAELVSIFGDDAGQFTAVLDRVLGAAFTGDELAQQRASTGRDRASDLLGGLGIDVTDELFTQQGLRGLLDEFLGTLSAEDTATLLSAGDAIASVIKAEKELADVRGESLDRLADDWQRVVDDIRGALNNQLVSGPSSLTPIERLNAAELQLRQAAAAAQGGDLQAGQQVAGLFQQAINLGAGVFGSATEQFAAFEADLRGLLQGLTLGPEGLSVGERQLNAAIEIRDIQRDQLAELRDLNGNAPIGGSGGGGPGVNGAQQSQQALSDSVRVLRQIEGRITQQAQGQETTGQLTLQELAQIRQLLTRQIELGTERGPQIVERSRPQ